MPDNAALHLIVGLGNYGEKYARTRHNAGFMVVEALARKHGLSFNGRQARALVAKGRIEGVPVVLALPQTYMNDSGEAVSGLVRWHKIPLDRLMVVYDELDLPVGTIRMRERGSTAGHNGMKSINAHLRSDAYPRLRIGIDKPPSGDTIPWVLGHFNKEEQREFDAVVTRAIDAIESWLTGGIERAMNTFNSASQQTAPKRGRPIPTDQPPHAGGETQPADQSRSSRERPELPGLGGEIRQLRSRLFGNDEQK